MIEYKSEIVKIPIRIFKETITEAVTTSLDELINKRAAEGWKLSAHSVAASADIGGCYMIVTFCKE